MLKYLCIDIEASGLKAGSYPIELAFVDPLTAHSQCWMIKPTDEWLEGPWEAEAERLHGISLQTLNEEGVDPVFVAQAFADAAKGARLVSDCPSVDQRWLEKLLSLIGLTRVFIIDDLEEVARRITWGKGLPHTEALAEARTFAHSTYPKTHRALQDARHNAAILSRLIAAQPQ